jgi:cytochrome c oxidase subunit IV
MTTSPAPSPAPSRFAKARDRFHALPKDIREYLIVFALLMALLLLTVLAALPDFGSSINLSIALTIAIIKAILVVLYFMHVRQASQVTWVFAGAAFLWLGIMIALTMTDYATRNHTPNVIKDVPAAQLAQPDASMTQR